MPAEHFGRRQNISGTDAFRDLDQVMTRASNRGWRRERTIEFALRPPPPLVRA